MRARDLFGVGVRLMGVWFFTDALYWAFFAAVKSGGGPGNPRLSVAQDTAEAVIYVLTGAFLLLMADWLVRALYGPQVLSVPAGAGESPLQ